MSHVSIVLSVLSDAELESRVRRLAGEERRLAIEVIAHLEELERRKLYLKLGYSSLFEWCTYELKYSAAAAQRRIDAMRLSREIPEVCEAVAEGRLNLSSVAQAQKFFRHEKKTQGKITRASKSAISSRSLRVFLRASANGSSRPSLRLLRSKSGHGLFQRRKLRSPSLQTIN